MRRLPLLAARVLFMGYSLATAVYCLMAYLPFTYHHAGNLIGWPKAAVAVHPWLNLGAVALVLLLLREPWRRGGWPRRLAAGLAIWQAACAIALIVHPVLAGLQNDGSSLAWSLVALIPPGWLAAIDICTHWHGIEWGEQPAGAAHFAAAWRSAIFVTFLYACVAVTRSALRPAAAALGWSLLVHLLVFLALFLALDWLARIAGLFRTRAKVEFWLCHLLLAGAVWEVVQAVFCPAVGFAGWPSFVFAGALGLVLASQNVAAALIFLEAVVAVNAKSARLPWFRVLSLRLWRQVRAKPRGSDENAAAGFISNARRTLTSRRAANVFIMRGLPIQCGVP